MEKNNTKINIVIKEDLSEEALKGIMVSLEDSLFATFDETPYEIEAEHSSGKRVLKFKELTEEEAEQVYDGTSIELIYA